MDLEDQLLASLRRHNVDIRFFSYTNLITYTIDGRSLPMRIECEVVESAIRQAVAIILGVFDLGD